MKLVLTSLILFAGSISSAIGGVREYEIKKANFDKGHVDHFMSGTVSINYQENKVSMDVQYSNQVQSEIGRIDHLQTELKIVSIGTDACGVHHVTGKRDMRPADGILEVLKVMDASDATCKKVYTETASYETSYYNWFPGSNGGETREFSTMELRSLALSSRSYQFAAGNLVEGFPSLEIPVDGSVEINAKNIDLHVGIGLNCAVNRPCPAYMPHPVRATLPIVEIRDQNNCGTTYVARSESDDINGNHETKQIVFTDWSKAVACDIAYLYPIEVEYTNTIVNSKGVRYVKKGIFSFVGGF